MNPGKKGHEAVIAVDITTEYPAWHQCNFDLEALARKCVQAAIESSDVADILQGRAVEASMVLCDDQFIRVLNRDYRDKDKPTNVLSFPQTDFNEQVVMEPVPLGDIIIAYETMVREAEEQSKTLESHFIHMVIHGTLHLLGYDHITEEDAEHMESLEIRILKDFGIENPYLDLSIMR